ncbi:MULTISPECIES: nucleoside triphosphate pyrophosphohydrolase [Acinetobacter]|uniref:Nucleoside triphosphate pyrophosphohydrolase n=1 Tax=Acinetobacter indicus TaxID=756892 RepID=A0A6C0Y4D6_9GAMM|nr:MULTISPECIES: nucleoside triphosphate pyrophosphohydrolase [Acinetobacter]ENW86023.1 hypothetical protein F905_02937 [Acinetobacter sp. CIP 53.82]MBA0156611.1 nucleoside triphosphate pyrophosphohydrolase [Acinetobacter indicus]MCO8100449.1 nucleoside triphosphate pyrophosphohydrolase [Acinetobacter indicus]MCO8105921.1 nucleoside triphosphate pyrophosphohydrolase [Acinetobacter indicus]MCO8111616.1 nucleoside triphosphate pyrophosphohydrolase [Acinetobacter indicus]
MDQLLAVMKQLREQCPWDQKQTPESLTRYAIEEAYEVEAAVRSGHAQDVKEELGDLLLQVVFQSQMYSEQGAFDFQDVVQAITDKMIRRHPHVFQPEQFAALSPEDVSALWQQIKQQEKAGKPASRLSEVKHGPAIQQAQQLQHNVAQIGFDFPDVTGAMQKVDEELQELKQAVDRQNSDEILDELGDCLFSLINVGRKLNLSSEMALLSTVHKFRTRFAFIEQQLQQQHKNIEQVSLAEMDQLWEQAKQQLK